MKSKRKNKNLFIIIVIISLLLFLTTSTYAIYKNLSITADAISFFLKLSTVNEPESTEVTVNAPKLVSGMIPIIWNENSSLWQVVSSSDSSWYNYSSDIKHWANVMMPDTSASNLSVGDTIAESDLGSIFVWIPRYEYKINYFTDSTYTTSSASYTRFGKIDINFIPSTVTSPSNGYTVHPAFKNGTSNNFSNGEWDSNLDGIWFSKFEACGSNSVVKSVPNASAYQKIAIGGTSSNKGAYQISKTQTYGCDTTNAALLNSHLQKNSEWGAACYLAYSNFGRGTVQPDINNYVLNKTAFTTCSGYSGGSATVAITNNALITNKYNTTIGVGASTTGNIYGIYDLVGGRTEFAAGYLAGTTGLTEEISISANSKYYTAYSALPSSGTDYEKLSTVSKPGDAIGETMLWDSNAAGVASNSNTNLVYLSSSAPYFMRGGTFGNGKNDSTSTKMCAGIFSFYVNICSSSGYRGFRTVLCID